MIYACPICGSETGVTHGDQTFVVEVCEECKEMPGLMEWYRNHKQEKVR